eukprot:6204135-Pleurochrysis_carterae.AAC.2
MPGSTPLHHHNSTRQGLRDGGAKGAHRGPCAPEQIPIKGERGYKRLAMRTTGRDLHHRHSGASAHLPYERDGQARW